MLLTFSIALSIAFARLGPDLELRAAPPEQAQSSDSGHGLSKESAIEVCRPNGEQAYLDRLRCPNGNAVRYKRAGSFGFRNEPKSPDDDQAVMEQMMGGAPTAGQKDFHTVDGFDLRCKRQKLRVYLDMYHCPEPETQVTPPGFTLQEKATP